MRPEQPSASVTAGDRVSRGARSYSATAGCCQAINSGGLGAGPQDKPRSQTGPVLAAIHSSHLWPAKAQQWHPSSPLPTPNFPRTTARSSLAAAATSGIAGRCGGGQGDGWDFSSGDDLISGLTPRALRFRPSGASGTDFERALTDLLDWPGLDAIFLVSSQTREYSATAKVRVAEFFDLMSHAVGER